MLEDYDKTLQLIAVGVQKYPHYSSFYRVGMYASDKVKKYEDAVNYGNKLFNTADTIKYTANDYIYYAEALMNTGKFDEAIAAYKHIPEVDPENKETNKLISGLYVKAHRFPEAVAAMEQHITEVGENATYKELDALADIYIDEASVEGATDAVKKAAFENADKVYARMVEKYDYAATYAVWKRALMNHQINSDVKVGRALPYYQQFISLVEPKAEKTASELNKLAIAYTYLAVHYIQNDKKDEAKAWAHKLAEIRPDDPNAQQILSIK